MPEGYLNLEYILLKVYHLFAGVDAGEVPAQTLMLIERVAWLGIAVSFIFLALIIYLRMRLGHVEHAGWHRRQEEEVVLMKKNEAPVSRNPRWDRVVALAHTPAPEGEDNWRLAILEADSILADLLNERGLRGDSVGEQLRDANPLQFTTLDLAWQAHKMRNALAHMGEAFPLTERDVHATIDLYRRVFEEFDYI